MRDLRIIVSLAACMLLTMCTVFGADKKVVPSKNYVTKEIPSPRDFTSLLVSGIVDVEYTQNAGGRPTLSVYGPDNLVDLVTLEHSADRLEVGFRKGYRVKGECRLKVIASSSTLREILLSGTGDVDIKGPLATDGLYASLSGTGDLSAGRVDVEREVRFKLSGTGDLQLASLECADFTCIQSGTGDAGIPVLYCSAGEVFLGGTGDFGCRNMTCTTLSVRLTGTGDADLSSVGCDGFAGELHGTGDLTASVETPGAVSVRSASTGDAVISGRCADADFQCLSTGDISAGRLYAERVKVRSTGTGDIVCRASESITGSVDSVGSLSYYGDPATVNVRNSKIHKLD